MSTTATATATRQDTGANAIQPATEAHAKAKLLEAQLARIDTINGQMKKLKEEKDALEAELLDRYPIGRQTAGEYTLTITAGRRSLDPGKFEAAYPVSDNPTYYELKPKSMSTIAKHVGEDALANCIKTTKPTVKVSVNEQQ